MHRTAIALILVALAAPTAGALGSVDVVSLTSPVQPGDRVTLSARLDAGDALCRVTPRRPKGVAGGRTVAPRRSHAGQVTFTWRLAPRAKLGGRTVGVDCGAAGRDNGRYRVAATRGPVRLEVVNTGFSQQIAAGGVQFVTYGAIVRNPSAGRHASDITVTLNFVDASNRIVSTVAHDIEAIPPGKTFGVGGFTTVSGGELAAGFAVISEVRGDDVRVSQLPVSENVRMILGAGAALVAVRGEVVNPYGRAILKSARIYAVAYDAAGKVIGGGSGRLVADIASRARAGFEFGNGVDQLRSDQVASLAISVDPRLAD